jgi:Abortive infection alpha
MSDDNKVRNTADVVKGVLEAVPVYQDAIQPGAKEIGTALQTVGQAINAALLPLKGLVWSFKRIERYLQKTMAEKLGDVPPERIVTPNPAVAGPTVEALRFAAHEPSLRELYANLLATSMDMQTAKEAHPAFVEVIRQLNADEARLIQYIASFESDRFFMVRATMFLGFEGDEKGDGEEPSLELDPSNTMAVAAECSYPELIESYLDNIKRLGLVHIEEEIVDTGPDTSLFGFETQKDVWDAIIRYKEEIRGKDKLNYVAINGTMDEVRFTAFGKQFCGACVYAIDATTHNRK